MKNNQIQIEDYSLEKGKIFAQVSLPPLEGEANFFNLKFDAWDVIEAAASLKIINFPDDWDEGRSGQDIRLGYLHPAFSCQMQTNIDGFKVAKIHYFTYPKIQKEFSGEDREAIILYLACNNAQIENALLARAI